MEASSSVYDWGGNRPWHTSGALSLEGDAYRLYYERAAGNSRAGNPSYEEFVPRGAYYEWFFYSSAAGTKTLVARIPAP
jgi:hypothetical protein